MTDASAAPGFDPDGFDPSDRHPLPYRRVPGLRLSQAASSGEESEYFLKAPTGQLLVLRVQERFLWELLDGRSSFAGIESRFRARFGAGLAPAHFAKFLAELIELRAVEHIPGSEHRALLATRNVKKIELVVDGPAEPEPGNWRTEAGIGAAAPRRGNASAGRRRGGAMAGMGGGAAGGLREGIKSLWSRRLGNPDRFLAALARVFWPIRYVAWLLIPFLAVAFLISIKHSDQYFADWTALITSIPQWPCLWLAEHVTTWSARIAEGVVIYGFGGRVQEASVKLFLGLFIRIHLDESSVKTMPRRQKLWIASSPLVWRLAIFAVSMPVWIMYRTSHPIASQIALFMAFMGLVTFIMCCCPLIPLYGYKFLSTLLDQENLYGRSFRFLLLKIKGRAAPDPMTLAERWGLVLMAVGTTLFSSLYLGHIFYSASVWTANNLNGVGGWFIVALLTAFVAYILSLWRFSRKLRAMHRAARVRNGQSNAPAAQL